MHALSRFRPHWRKMTWALVAWNVLMLVWIIAGASSASGQPSDCGVLDAQTCNDASDAGAAIGVGLLVVLWFMGFMALSAVWFMTRRKDKADS